MGNSESFLLLAVLVFKSMRPKKTLSLLQSVGLCTQSTSVFTSLLQQLVINTLWVNGIPEHGND